jgi:hypothetical protein
MLASFLIAVGYNNKNKLYMKKLMTLLAGLTSLATAATAQIGIAPEIGLNIANMRGQYDYNASTGKPGVDKFKGGAKLGIKAGANFNINIADRLQIQPGIFYSTKGFKQGEKQNHEHGYFNAATQENVTLHFAEIPVNLQYMFNDPGESRFFVGIGGYMGVAFSGKTIKDAGTESIFPSYNSVGGADKSKLNSEGGSLKFGNDAPSNDMRRFDFGGQVNAGYQLRSGIFFRAMYQLGISNLLPQGNRTTGDATLRSSNATVSLGYVLGYKK